MIRLHGLDDCSRDTSFHPPNGHLHHPTEPLRLCYSFSLDSIISCQIRYFPCLEADVTPYSPPRKYRTSLLAAPRVLSTIASRLLKTYNITVPATIAIDENEVLSYRFDLLRYSKAIEILFTSITQPFLRHLSTVLPLSLNEKQSASHLNAPHI